MRLDTRNGNRWSLLKKTCLWVWREMCKQLKEVSILKEGNKNRQRSYYSYTTMSMLIWVCFQKFLAPLLVSEKRNEWINGLEGVSEWKNESISRQPQQQDPLKFLLKQLLSVAILSLFFFPFITSSLQDNLVSSFAQLLLQRLPQEVALKHWRRSFHEWLKTCDHHLTNRISICFSYFLTDTLVLHKFDFIIFICKNICTIT